MWKVLPLSQLTKCKNVHEIMGDFVITNELLTNILKDTLSECMTEIINKFCNSFTYGDIQKDFQWFSRYNNVTHDFVNGFTFSEFA